MLGERERERERGDSPPSLSINVLLFAITQVARLGQREEKQKKKKRRKKKEKRRRRKEPSVERHRRCPSSPKVIYFVWWPRACAAIQTWQFLPGLI